MGCECPATPPDNGNPCDTGEGYPACAWEDCGGAGVSTALGFEGTPRRRRGRVGVADLVGTLQPGTVADIIVLEADPLSNLDNLQSVSPVYKAGEAFDPGLIVAQPRPRGELGRRRPGSIRRSSTGVAQSARCAETGLNPSVLASSAMSENGIGSTRNPPSVSDTVPAGREDRASTPPERDDPEQRRVKAAVLKRLLPAVELESPKIGRFSVLRQVGRGGMGVVYAVYDDQLDRRVALKLLDRDASPDLRARLQREARAMARLSHPNVVPVFEVDEHEGEPFIVMEYVEGQTLRQWLTETSRTAEAILEKYAQAGRGLAAAHAIGLVHRDFKPDNAVVGETGRVRVLDFGLVRRQADAEQEANLTETALPTPDDDAFETPLTHAGGTLGTPAYMAPEQFLGEDTDARTDQFSFCVALWEALCGERPFAGNTRTKLAAHVTAGKLRPPPRDAVMPRWVRPVLERGLQVDPARRWPSMDALLASLLLHQRRRRRRRIFAGVALAGVAVAGIAGTQRIMHHRAVAGCKADGAAIDEVWNDERREAVRQGLLATGAGYAATTAEKIMPWLDEQAAAWREARAEACMDANVRGRWDADMLDRSAWCLDERRTELDALLTELQDADAKTLTGAVPAAAGLRQVDPCRDETLLTRVPAPPAEGREAVAALRAKLSMERAMTGTGAYAAALELATENLEEAQALGWPPLLAAAKLRVGSLLADSGAYQDSAAMLEEAYFEAARTGAMEEAYEAAQLLMGTVDQGLAGPTQGERWGKHADVMRSALPDPAGLREAQSRYALGDLLQAQGKYKEAEREIRQALALDEQALGPDHPQIAISRTQLGIVLDRQGRYVEAETEQRRALALKEQALGPDHPRVGSSHFNLANVLYNQRRYEEAEAEHRRGLAVMEGALGPDHPNVAISRINLGNVLERQGRYEEARAQYRRALAVLEPALGPGHPNVATLHTNLGAVLAGQGKYEEAEVERRRGLALAEKALGPDHPLVARFRCDLASFLLDRGAAKEALGLAETAWRRHQRGDTPREAQACAAFSLARALWDAPPDGGRDRPRALEVAEQARDAYRDIGDVWPEFPARIETWLRDHRGAE